MMRIHTIDERNPVDVVNIQIIYRVSYINRVQVVQDFFHQHIVAQQKKQ